MIICTFPGDVSVFRPRPFSLTCCYPATRESSGMRRHLKVIRTPTFKDPKSDDTYRLMWSSAPFPEMSASTGREDLVSPFVIQRPEIPGAHGDTLRLSAPFVIQRQASLLTRRDQCGLLHPSRRCQRLLADTAKKSHFCYRDPRVR